MRRAAFFVICGLGLLAGCSVERTPLPAAGKAGTSGVSGGGSVQTAGNGAVAGNGINTGLAGTASGTGAADGGSNVGLGDGSVLGGGLEAGLHTDAGVDAGPQGYRPGAVGAPCATNADCEADRLPRTCFTPEKLGGLVNLSGGYCGTFCDVAQGGACEPGAVCITIPVVIAPVFACMRPCQVDTDCRVAEGYTCNKPGTSNSKVCSLPN